MALRVVDTIMKQPCTLRIFIDI